MVVGGGISGLSAALFYQDRHPGRRILILDNHDDFGGHAKREFMVRGHTLILNGGTAGSKAPPYSKPMACCKRLGIDVPALAARYGDGESEDGTLAGCTWAARPSSTGTLRARRADPPARGGAPGDALAQAPLSPPPAPRSPRSKRAPPIRLGPCRWRSARTTFPPSAIATT
jgi:spermidine dehydrogenase